MTFHAHQANHMRFADSPNLPEQMTIGNWVVRPHENSITQANRVTRIAPKTMDLLVYLARKEGHVVSKAELFEQLWAPNLVSDSALYVTVAELRRAFGDDARNPTYIETIPKRGYRIIETVKDIEQDLPKGKGRRTISTLRNWSRRAFSNTHPRDSA